MPFSSSAAALLRPSVLPMSGTAWSSEDAALRITDDRVAARLERMAFSVSAAQAMQQCEARWVASQLVPERKLPMDAASLGVHAHANLETFYGKYPPARRDAALLRHLLTEYLDRTVRRAAALAPVAAASKDPALMPALLSAYDTELDAEVRVERAVARLGIDGTLEAHGICLDAATELLRVYDESHPRGPGSLGSFLTRTWPDLAAESEALAAMDDDAREAWRAEVARLTLGDLAIEQPTQVDVIAVEYRFRGQSLSNGSKLNGFIDRVQRMQDGTVGICDYKTGAFREPFGAQRDEKADQIRIYADGYANATGERVTEGMLIYTGNLPAHGTAATEGCGLPKTVDMRPAAIADSVAWFASQHEAQRAALERRAFRTSPSPLCAWCPLANACPVAQIGSSGARAKVTQADAEDAAGIKRSAKQQQRVDAARAKLRKAQDAAARKPPPEALGIGTDLEPERSGPRIVGIETDATARSTTMTMTTTPPADATEPSPAPIPALQREWAENVPRPADLPYNELVQFGDRQILNLDSYAATRGFGVAQLALQIARKQVTTTVHPARIQALAEILAALVRDVEVSLSGRSSMNSGLNTRIMGAVRTVIDEYGLPSIDDAQEVWCGWYELTAQRVLMISRIGIGVHTSYDSIDPAASMGRLCDPDHA